MTEESQSESNLPAQPKRSASRRRGHRGGRGRRRPISSAPVPDSPGEKDFQQIDETISTAPPPEPFQKPQRQDFDESAISRAVEEVTQVVEALKQSLAQMEEVLELVELAERQKLGDEREIDSLRRALRQLQSRRQD